MRWLYAVIPVLLLGGLITWRLQQKIVQTQAQAEQMKMRVKAPASVELAAVAVHDVVKTFTATGSVEAPLDVKIAAKITGRINYMTVQEGDRVRKGQVLVRIDPTAVEATVNQQKAALAEAKYRLAQAQLTQAPANVQVNTQIRQQQAAVDSARADYAQVRQNYESQLAAAAAAVSDAQSKVESAKAAVENAQTGIESAKTNVESGKASMENAQASITSVQANLDNANTKLTRILDLYKQGYVAAQDVDDAKAAVAVQQGAVDVAKGQFKMATAAFNVQKAAVDTALGQLKVATAAYNSTVSQKQSAEEQANIVKTKGKADIEAARTRLQQAEAALEYAKANTAQTPAYAQSLAALRASVDAARASLALAESQRADTILSSPLDGVVTARYMDPGSMAGANQPIIAVQFVHQVWVTIAVPEDVFARIHFGQPATVRFDSLANQTFTGSIIQMNPAADPQGRQFTVRVILDNAKNLFKPGMFATVSIETQHVPHAIVVPREAVQQDAHGSGGAYVMVVDAQNVAHKRPVITGATDDAQVQILSGVQLKEKVVTMSARPLREGAVVSSGEGKGRRGGKRGGKPDSGETPGAQGAAPVPGQPQGAAPPAGGADGQAPGGHRQHGGKAAGE